MLIWGLSSDWVALFWIQTAGQFILDPSWCLLRLSQQLLTRSASTQSSDKACTLPLTCICHSSKRKKNLILLPLSFSPRFQHLLGCPASPQWMKVEGKHWRRPPPRPPPPPPPRLAPTPPTWPARAQARRMKPSPSWRTSSWMSWTKFHVSVSFFSPIWQWDNLRAKASSVFYLIYLWFLVLNIQNYPF